MLFVVVVIGAVLAQRITAPTLHRVRAAFTAETVDDEAVLTRSVVEPAPVPGTLAAIFTGAILSCPSYRSSAWMKCA